METQWITSDISRAAELIRAGELVAVPTETVYGLAGNGLDEAAVEKIYEVKDRPPRKPLSLMVPGPEALALYGRELPPGAYTLAEAFWPGPLTIVVKAPEEVPAAVLAGGDTVGLRCPDQAQTLALLRACGLPLAAPSANPSGAESPKSAEAVRDYFDGKIAAIIDGGPCGIGRESSIVDLSEGRCRLLRQGALSMEQIRKPLVNSLKIVGVTGGTGCGKTTALRALEALGALVIDADAVYHDLCRSCEEMLAEIGERFPGVVQDGVLQRRKLGEIVFSDEKALQDLRSITIRYIDERIDELLADHAVNGGRFAAVDAIDIIGTPLQDRLCATVGITAPVKLRAARIMAREGISEEYAMLRIQAQKPNEFFEQNCDRCICNDGSMEEFFEKSMKIFRDILEV